MSDIAIRVENLSKRYRIGALEPSYRTIRESITSAFTSPFRRLKALARGESAAAASETIWALKDVSFEVKRGEVVGIIGRNGAGKSTLLKILARITEPTSGRAQLYGRVGSLLEVGTGFHPELTGRENIYLNGAILGMKRAEIHRKFHDIVAFAEVEQFIDTPVKHYSSGMFLRLAFAVAAHLEPEILVVDEVLAVGDAVFQKRCLGKMGEVARGGRTVLFVSHNMTAVQSLCPSCICIEQGKIVCQGYVNNVVHHYLAHEIDDIPDTQWNDIEQAPGNEFIRVRRIAIDSFAQTKLINLETPFQIKIEYWNLKPDTYLNLSLFLLTHDGTIVFNSASVLDNGWFGKQFPKGLFQSVCYIPANLLNRGIYRINIMFVHNAAHVVFRWNDALSLEVVDSPVDSNGWHGSWPGVIHPRLKWQTMNLD